MPPSASSSSRCAASKRSSGTSSRRTPKQRSTSSTRDRLARQPARHGLDADELGLEPAPALPFGDPVPVEVRERAPRVLREPDWIDRRLGVDPLAQVGGAVEVVDEPVDVAAQPQGELEITVDEVQAQPTGAPAAVAGCSEKCAPVAERDGTLARIVDSHAFAMAIIALDELETELAVGEE